MPNGLSAYLTNLTFGGTDLQRSNLSVHLDIVFGLNDGLEVRGVDTVIPSAVGRVPRNRKADIRHIQLVGWLQPVGATNALRESAYQVLRDEMEALFSQVAAPATLSGTAPNGSTRSILARTENIIWNESPVFALGELTISLDSVVPAWTVT